MSVLRQKYSSFSLTKKLYHQLKMKEILFLCIFNVKRKKRAMVLLITTALLMATLHTNVYSGANQ